MKVLVIVAALIFAWFVGMLQCLYTVSKTYPLAWKVVRFERTIRDLEEKKKRPIMNKLMILSKGDQNANRHRTRV